eukprot:365272-Chlamydomonas_euryale.AAC.15
MTWRQRVGYAGRSGGEPLTASGERQMGRCAKAGWRGEEREMWSKIREAGGLERRAAGSQELGAGTVQTERERAHVWWIDGGQRL